MEILQQKRQCGFDLVGNKKIIQTKEDLE